MGASVRGRRPARVVVLESFKRFLSILATATSAMDAETYISLWGKAAGSLPATEGPKIAGQQGPCVSFLADETFVGVTTPSG
jgi:hypothetical protein